MTNPIHGLGRPQPLTFPTTQANFAQPASANDRSSFQDLLQGSIEQANSLQQTAQTNIERGLAGDDMTQVEVFSSVKKADLALRMMVQIRNKVLDAYQEIKQMQM